MKKSEKQEYVNLFNDIVEVYNDRGKAIIGSWKLVSGVYKLTDNIPRITILNIHSNKLRTAYWDNKEGRFELDKF